MTRIVYTNKYITNQFNKLTDKEKLHVLFETISRETSEPLKAIAKTMGYVVTGKGEVIFEEERAIIKAD